MSENSLKSTGQKWEIKCALEEQKPVLGIRAYKDDPTVYTVAPFSVLKIKSWTDANISDFIDKV